MGLIQNKVTVSQPNSHVVVKNAGGLRGLTGETGPQGPQGVPGEAATVTVGTTTTLPAGSEATVQNVGSTSAAIFNFGIPKGDKGDTGEAGTAATISVGTTTTLEPGEDATVTNSGTSSAAVFDFGIPKGAKGDTGATGPAGQDGADGFSPTATVSKTGDTATITITDKDGTTTAQISDGVTPTIDSALSPTSENPVQNKVVTNALAGKADKPIVVSSLPATGTTGQEYLVDDRYNTVTDLKGDTQQTTYSGKNLLNLVPVSSTSNGITTTLNADGSLTCSGTASDTWANVTTTTALPQTLSASDVVVFSIQDSITAQLYARTLVSSPYQRKDYIINVGNTSSGSSTIGMAADSVYLFLNNLTVGTTYNFTIKQAQLEKSSTPTSFEPYVGGTASPNPDYPQEVQTVTGEQTITVSDGQGNEQEYKVWLKSKNLFDKNAITANVLVRRDNGITNENNNFSASDYIPVEEGQQYTFTNGFDRWYSAFYDSSKQYVGYPTNTQVITIPTGVKYIRLTVYNSLLDEAQFEKGSTATTYAAYFTPIELCKIGTYQDYIYKSGEDWYLHKETGKVTFTGAGTETWSSATAATGYVRFSTASGATHADNNGYCNEFINRGSQSHGAYEYVWVQPAANAFYIQVLNSRANDLAGFRTWLGTNPATVYYDISTATDTQITNADLIAQLEALAGAKIMVDGGTATVTSQYLPATLTTAYNSNSGYIDYIYDGTNFVKVR